MWRLVRSSDSGMKASDVDAARVNVEMLLLPGQLVFAFALRELNIPGGDERRVDGADRIGVEAVAVADRRPRACVRSPDRPSPNCLDGPVEPTRASPRSESFVDQADHLRVGTLRLVFGASPNSFAVFWLMIAKLSQVILLIGLGSSCSQPLLAKRPS